MLNDQRIWLEFQIILSYDCLLLGGYTSDHRIIKWFWEAVESFTDHQKRQLLKFVTSCSRPPLLGFKVSVK